MQDQSDIGRYRHTYVGSKPASVINDLKTVEVKNIVFLFDEVDKLRGKKRLQVDLAAALLEVLDPDQNHNFTHYCINAGFDLLEALHIATANFIAIILHVLVDKMESVRCQGMHKRR